MTSGIYQLNFNDQAFYVGQSINIEVRWKQHFDKFRKGTAAKKMQDAYNYYGLPNATILLECHKDYLDMMENFYIAANQPYSGNLNTTAPAVDPDINYTWLLNNRKLLIHSQFSIIKQAVDTTGENTALENELNELKNNFNERYLYIKAQIEIKKERDKNAEYKNLYPSLEQAYAQTQEAINKLQSRGLLKRIFNYD